MKRGPEGTVKICINLFRFHENDQIMKVFKLVKIKNNSGITGYLNCGGESKVISIRGNCSRPHHIFP